MDKIKMTFGECLKQFLQIRGWPATRLAKEINIAPSYVHMWIRGERIPSMQSDYISQIASSITAGLNNVKKTNIADSYYIFFDHLGITKDDKKTLCELVEGALTSTQTYSLTLKPKKRKANYTVGKDKMSNIINQIESEISLGKNNYFNSFFKAIDDIPLLIEGQYSVLCAIITFLQSSISDNTPKELIFTCQGNTHIFYSYDMLYKKWNSLITTAMDNKWQIKVMHQVSKNKDSSFKMVNELIDWSSYINYFTPSFFLKFGSIEPPIEIIIIKKVGAFILLSAENSETIDGALFFRQKGIVEKLYKFVLKMNSNTMPVFKLFPTFSNYSEFLALNRRIQGDLYMVSLDLYAYTVPLPLWEKYLASGKYDETIREKYYKRMSELSRVFLSDVEKYKIKHICSMEALEYMIETGDYFCKYYCAKADPEDIIKHLEHIVYLLKTYENFEIALLSEISCNINLSISSWEVKGGRYSGITTVNVEDCTKYNYIAINDVTIAHAFSEYFLYLWECLTPKHKDKEYVISWFEEQLEIFKKNRANKNKEK